MTRINNTLVLLLFSLFTIAQSECKDVLFIANSLFEEGKIQESIDALAPCIDNIKDKQEALEGYKILAIAYQEMREVEPLDVSIKKLLSLHPNYQKYPNGDPSIFTKELAKY